MPIQKVESSFELWQTGYVSNSGVNQKNHRKPNPVIQKTQLTPIMCICWSILSGLVKILCISLLLPAILREVALPAAIGTDADLVVALNIGVAPLVPELALAPELILL